MFLFIFRAWLIAKGTLPLESVLLLNVCIWSILMMYHIKTATLGYLQLVIFHDILKLT